MKELGGLADYSYQDAGPSCTQAYLTAPLFDLLPARGGLRLLDLGCGNGSLTDVLRRRGNDVVGVDASATGIANARSGYPECTFIHASIYDLPLDELGAAFDAVVAVEVIEHLPYPRELLRSARKCLKPGGRLIVSTPYHGYLKNLALAAAGRMDGHFTALWDGGHVKFFSAKTLRALFEDEGYTDLRFRFAGRLPALWKSMLCSGSPGAARETRAEATSETLRKTDTL
jgi:2-polyprenyl-3-methyl-5-hydroxy-6-metoxy-1,4-benzoquinol methylase